MGMKQYDPKSVTIAWNGVTLNEGIAAGTFILATRTSRDWTMSVGSDGEATRVRSNDETGTITVTLRSGSSTNALLTAILEGDKLSGTALAGLTIKDTQGNSVLIGVNAFIEGVPDFERGDAESNVEWTFLCERLNISHLGNADANA